MVVIYAASAMQVAGGIDYLVMLTDRLLRRHPKYLAVLAPLVTYLLTFMASTGQVSFATMPVIVEVAKDNNIRPTRSLSVAVAGSTALPRVCPHHEERAVPRMSPHARAAAPPR